MFVFHYSISIVPLHALSCDKEAARKHAKWCVSDIRRWSNHTFYSGLSDSRIDEEKTELVEEMWRKYEDVIAEAPEEHSVRTVHAHLRVKKL